MGTSADAVVEVVAVEAVVLEDLAVDDVTLEDVEVDSVEVDDAGTREVVVGPTVPLGGVVRVVVGEDAAQAPISRVAATTSTANEAGSKTFPTLPLLLPQLVIL